jgi:hypothetical protein
MSIKSKEFNPLKSLTPNVKPNKYICIFSYLPNLPTYLSIYLFPPTYLKFDFQFILTKIQKCHMAYWYYAMCHNLKPFKLDDENSLFIFLIFFFNCHVSLCKLLIFMVICRWYTIIYGWRSICWPLISSTLPINV